MAENTVEIMNKADFWEKDPAPGTVFFDLDVSVMELVGEKIDPKLDDPDNAVMISLSNSTTDLPSSTVAVVKWGDWNTEENREIFRLRQEAKELMLKENGESNRLRKEC